MLSTNIPAMSGIRTSLSGDLEGFKRNENNSSKKIIHLTFMSALHNGYLDCIRYLIENKLVDVVNKPYCDIAAKRGHYECLKYLHENGCKFNKYTALIAMIREDHRCLSYIIENGGELSIPYEC